MQVRSIGQLKRDQVQMLADIKATGEPVAGPNGAESMRPMGSDVLGRISEVAQGDPEHGPRLKVVMQLFKGKPPTAVDAAQTAVVCYPPPGSSVGDYAEDEYVCVSAWGGTKVARKM